MTMTEGATGVPAAAPPPAAPPVAPPAPPSGQGSENPPPAAPPEQPPAQPDYSLASGFLQQIPEADRPIVEKYVGQWDAGVTRRFQDLHSKYQPYEELGDVAQLQAAIQVMRLLDERPQDIYRILLEDIQQGAEWAQGLAPGQQQQNLGGGPSGENGDAFQGLPPEIQQKLALVDSQQQMLEHLAKIVVGNQQQEVEAREDAALDEYLTNLRTEFKTHADQFGPYDEDYVLARMERGEDGATAVQAYYNLLQQGVNAALAPQNQQPPILSGGGAPPAPQGQKITDLGTKETRSLVADLMAQTNKAQQ